MNPLNTMSSTASGSKAMSLLEEFKAFALKGNVIDLAVGVIIGAAFGKIVDSLVKHIIMPLVAAVTPGDQGYKGWKLTVNGSDILIGEFLGEVLNFLIVALALFIFIKKLLGILMRTKREEIAQVPPLTKDQELLTEIRDQLKSRPA